MKCYSKRFQSTHPLRGATYTSVSGYRLSLISIHAPLAGCDRSRQKTLRFGLDFNPRTPRGVRQDFKTCLAEYINFNPRTPRGVRHVVLETSNGVYLFQSTHPSRGATCGGCLRRPPPRFISIHAPLAGCDRVLPEFREKKHDFNPRTPCGVRRVNRPPMLSTAKFQSTHPLRGATRKIR